LRYNKGTTNTIKSINIIKKIFFAILLVVILLGTPMIASSITNLFDFSNIDPDGAFLWITVRHTLQALIILALIGIITKFSTIKFNLGLGDSEIGMRYLKRFMGIFLIYTIITFLVILILRQFEAFPFPMNAKNIFGHLGFQLFLSGPSEELIFRAFAITIFSSLITNNRINRHLSYANLFAMLIFGIAHVAISFSPLGFDYTIPQVLLAMGLGYFYGGCYEKSKSVIYPMIMHSYTNILMVVITILLTIII
jgi:uncharacterized protein